MMKEFCFKSDLELFNAVYCGCNCYKGMSMMSVVCRIMCIVGVTATRV